MVGLSVGVKCGLCCAEGSFMLKTRVLPLLFVLALVGAACGGSESVSDDSTRDDSGTIVEGGDVGVFVLEVGDCFDDGSGTEIASVAAVPCNEPHDNEVVDKFELDGGDWPGLEEVQMQSLLGCLDRFEAAVGEPYETSPLDIGPLYPTEEGWKQGDHEVICVVFNVDFTKLENSVLA